MKPGPQRTTVKIRWAVAACAVMTTLLVSACADPAAGGERRTLEGAASSPTALAERILTALSAGDTSLLSTVRLTEREHNELVWPELPAAQPEANFPVELAWENIETRNLDAVSNLMARFGGRDLSLEYVECRGETAEFQSFEVLTDCYVGFRDGPDVAERQLFKDVVRMNGQYKIFRYYK